MASQRRLQKVNVQSSADTIIEVRGAGDSKYHQVPLGASLEVPSPTQGTETTTGLNVDVARAGEVTINPLTLTLIALAPGPWERILRDAQKNGSQIRLNAIPKLTTRFDAGAAKGALSITTAGAVTFGRASGESDNANVPVVQAEDFVVGDWIYDPADKTKQYEIEEVPGTITVSAAGDIEGFKVREVGVSRDETTNLVGTAVSDKAGYIVVAPQTGYKAMLINTVSGLGATYSGRDLITSPPVSLTPATSPDNAAYNAFDIADNGQV